MLARDIIKAVSIPRYWRDHIRPTEDLETTPVVLCPFHNDHNPSMRYNAEKKYCKCFSCGAGGSVVSLHMANMGITSEQEAVEDLGRLYQVQDNILTLSEVYREVEMAQSSITLSIVAYKAITVARKLNTPKVYCELDEIMSQSDLAEDQTRRLKDFIGRHMKDGKLTP